MSREKVRKQQAGQALQELPRTPPCPCTKQHPKRWEPQALHKDRCLALMLSPGLAQHQIQALITLLIPQHSCCPAKAAIP